MNQIIYRKSFPLIEKEEFIREILKSVSQRFGIIVDEVGNDQDHINAVCTPLRPLPIR